MVRLMWAPPVYQDYGTLKRRAKPRLLNRGIGSGAVRERCFHVDLGQHLGDALPDVVARQDLATSLHQVGDTAPVARPLEQVGRDERDRLRLGQAAAVTPRCLRTVSPPWAGPVNRPDVGATSA